MMNATNDAPNYEKPVHSARDPVDTPNDSFETMLQSSL
jgi:hypothetical protein